jgi:hypothetical protein
MGVETRFAAFIDEPPVIEINGGIARISYRRADIERVMSVRTLRRVVERGKRALERHAAGDEHVVIDE